MDKTASLILLCAGSGSRMKGFTKDKVLFEILDKPLFLHGLESFFATGYFKNVILVYRDDEQQIALENAIKDCKLSIDVSYIKGGHERMHSVLAGLQHEQHAKYVFVHDAARPVVTSNLIEKMMTSLEKYGSAVAAHPCVDTMKFSEAGADMTVPQPLQDIDRSRLWHMETPQAFIHEDILSAYQAAIDQSISITDEASALSRLGKKVALVENTVPNPKFTIAGDRHFIEHLLRYES